MSGHSTYEFFNQLKLLSDQALDAGYHPVVAPIEKFINDWLKRFRKSFFTATEWDYLLVYFSLQRQYIRILTV